MLLLRILPLALSAATLICLAVLFAACTSSSSPQALYFVRVNISEFPTVDGSTVARSFGYRREALDLSNTAQDIAQGLPDVPGTTAGQVGSHIQDVTHGLQDLKMHLPDYFAVGLWGYCEGSHDADTFSNCTEPNASFSFDLIGILGDRLGQIDGLLPKSSQRILRKYHQVSQWAVGAYIIGLIGTALSIIIGLVKIPCGNMVVAVSSIATTVFIIGASASMTAIYSMLVGGIQTMLQPVGIHASPGSQMLAATWLAVGFSIASALVWGVGACCCCF